MPLLFGTKKFSPYLFNYRSLCSFLGTFILHSFSIFSCVSLLFFTMTAFDILRIGASIPLLILIFAFYWTAFFVHFSRNSPEINQYQVLSDEETTNNKVLLYFRRVGSVIRNRPKTYFGGILFFFSSFVHK
jgi:hypothetical protein